MTISLSAILIAKDEERDLPECLASLQGLASEIVVVVDEACSDRTEAIARIAGAKVARRAFDDYSRQRQASLEAAGGEWCLWIDADERVSPELKAAILEELKSPRHEAYSIAFAVWFMGRRLRWGGLGSERHVRLFKRARARFSGGALHEGLAVEGSIGRLEGTIAHVPYRDEAEYVEKMNRYTTLAAEKRWNAGQRFKIWHHLIPSWEFFSRAVLKGGFLDGKEGLAWAALSSFHSRLKYAKLKEMEKNQGARAS